MRRALIAAVVVLTALPALAADRSGIRCTRDYAPVCARGEGGLRTWNNRSCARHYGARVVHAGVCARDVELPQPSSAGFGDCIPVLKPVCAENNGVRTTYANVCTAARAGAEYLYTGECWALHP